MRRATVVWFTRRRRAASDKFPARASWRKKRRSSQSAGVRSARFTSDATFTSDTRVRFRADIARQYAFSAQAAIAIVAGVHWWGVRHARKIDRIWKRFADCGGSLVGRAVSGRTV